MGREGCLISIANNFESHSKYKIIEVLKVNILRQAKEQILILNEHMIHRITNEIGLCVF